MTMGGEQAIIDCDTTKGPFTMRFYHDWSPNGYDRAVDLYEKGFYDGSHFFRAVPKFLVQFGITYSTDESLRHLMHDAIEDDPQLNPPVQFDAGVLSYAGSGPNSRTSQMFISYGKNEYLGKELWETPFGVVESGMENVEKFYSYGDMPPWGKGPEQQKIYDGPQYISDNFPLIDKFESCSVKRVQAGDADYNEDEAESEEEAEIDEMGRDMGEGEDEEEEEGEEDDDEFPEKRENADERVMENAAEMGTNSADHRELNRMAKGVRGVSGQISPTVGLITVAGLAVVAYILKSVFQSSRKVSQKKN